MNTSISRALTAILASGLAVTIFSIYTYQAAAFMGSGDEDRTEIRTENKADVHNDVSVVAKTGSNEAEGGEGGDGEEGGDATRGTAGAGGHGGRGGDGGAITTGVASALGTIYNDVNSTRIVVEGCGCDEDPVLSRFMHFGAERDHLDIHTKNEAQVHNGLVVEAKTGHNEVDGGDGGDGEEGGDAGDRHSRNAWMNWFSWWNDENTGGAGGNGGAGGYGGTVETGNAVSDGLIDNIINNTVVRTSRGESIE
ncbi:MAG: hypothetical protein RL097_288 [Candidatus Parcubacteria bacterium]